jgi:hypothetical protein
MPFADHEAGLAHRRAYQKTPEGKARHAAATKAYRQRNKKKLAAHNAIAKAILRDGLVPDPCFVCGCTQGVEGHHPDYDHPLQVVWLCGPHHKAAHALGKECDREKVRRFFKRESASHAVP